MTPKELKIAKVNLLNTMMRAKDIGSRDFYLFQLLDASSTKANGELFSDLIMKDLVTLTKRTEGTIRIQLKKLENAGLISPVYIIGEKNHPTESWQEVLDSGLRTLQHTRYRIEIDKIVGNK